MATSLALDNSYPADVVSERLLILEDLVELTERAQNHTHATGTAVAIRQGDSLIVRTGTGLIPEIGAVLKCGQGLAGACSDKPYCGSPSVQELDAPLVAIAPRSLIVVPVRADGEFLGILLVMSQVPEAFNRIHTAILMSLTGEAARMFRRLEALNAAAPAPPKSIQPATSVAPLAAPPRSENVAETVAPVETKSPLRPKSQPETIAVVRPQPAVTLPETKPVPRIASPSALQMTDAPAVVPQTAPELLCAGDDPTKDGSLVNRPVQRETFTTGTVYRAPVRNNGGWIRLLYAAAVIAVAGAALALRPHLHMPVAAEPAPPAAQPISSSIPAPVVREASAPAPAPLLNASEPVKISAVTAERLPVRHEEPAAEKEAVVEPPVPVMTIAPGAAHESGPARVEAPSPTALSLASPAWTPELPAPKVEKPALAVHKSVAVAAVLLHRVAPLYPENARRMHVSGTVHLHVTISKSGDVLSAQAIDGPAILRQAALSAVRQWKYRPATLDGHPADSATEVIMKFSE